MATMLAPLHCTTEQKTGQLSLWTNAPPGCGAVVRLLHEVFDEADQVFVGILACTRGHRWIDMRDPKDARLHRKVGA